MLLSIKHVPLESITMLNDNVSIVFKNVKHSSVRVKPTCEVVVTVPELTPQGEIERILVKRHAWIET